MIVRRSNEDDTACIRVLLFPHSSADSKYSAIFQFNIFYQFVYFFILFQCRRHVKDLDCRWTFFSVLMKKFQPLVPVSNCELALIEGKASGYCVVLIPCTLFGSRVFVWKREEKTFVSVSK